jgi:hypothetical protein
MSKLPPQLPAVTRRALFEIERLEDRRLLTASGPHIPPYYYTITTPAADVSQQGSAMEVTIGQHPNGAFAVPKGPITVNFSASLATKTSTGVPIPLPASAADTFTPVSEALTFPAGAASQTVRVPINTGAANPDSVPIQLTVSGSNGQEVAGTTVNLVPGSPGTLAPPLPVITSAHLAVQRRTVTSIVLTFSQPMAPATVENVDDYYVTTFTTHQSLAQKAAGAFDTITQTWTFQNTDSETSARIRLMAAQYDPTTNTVTLIPRKPLSASMLYEISNAQQFLTDQQGNAIAGSGGPGLFAFTLKGARVLNWPAPQPVSISGGN